MDDNLRAQILAEIVEMTQGSPLEPDEFTVKQFAEASGLSRWQAATKLGRLVDGGKLEKRQAVVSGARCNVYRKKV